MNNQNIINEIRKLKKYINSRISDIDSLADFSFTGVNDNIVDTENAICEESEITSACIDDLENAVCELSKLVTG